MRETTMDPIDYQILDLLQRDARTTQVQIAEAVGLSQPSVADRIRKLDQAGAVLGYVARLDPRRVGNDVPPVLGVRPSPPPPHAAPPPPNPHNPRPPEGPPRAG